MAGLLPHFFDYVILITEDHRGRERRGPAVTVSPVAEDRLPHPRPDQLGRNRCTNGSPAGWAYAESLVGMSP